MKGILIDCFLGYEKLNIFEPSKFTFMQASQFQKLIAYTFILFLIVVSCANPVAPTGGPKDETPPEFLGSEPVNRANNFVARKVDLVFDEFVVLKELNKQLLVSPPMQEKLDVKTKGKGVRIRIHDEEVLVENTTYTIYFGDAIVDLHENNPSSNFQYVFATGNSIDSLSIRGKVLNAEFLKPAENVFVCLYIDNNDTLLLDEMPQKVRPYYVARTNVDGIFEINNIRYDKYLIFAVQDVNSNYYNDMPNETIAFGSELILPEEVFDFIPDSIPIDTANRALMDSLWANYAIPVTKQSHTLLLYQPLDSIQKVIRKEILSSNHMQFEFKYPLKEDMKISTLNADSNRANPIFLEEYSIRRDSLDLWFLEPIDDTIRLRIVVDTLEADTIELALKTFVDNKAEKNQKKKNSKIETIGYSNNFGSIFPYFSQAKVVFNTPIESANFDNCKLIEDSIPVDFQARFVDEVKRKLWIDYPWKQGVKYHFEIPDQAIRDIYGISNDTIIADFKTTNVEDYGELQIQLVLPEENTSPWLVILFKGAEEKETLIASSYLNADSIVDFPLLKADVYRIKIIEDRDFNGRWSSGDYSQKHLPEKVFYHPNSIEIKAGWKINELIELKPILQENPSFKIKK